MDQSSNLSQNIVLSTVDPENNYTPYDQRPETYIVPVLFFIIFVVGVIGNGTLVIIFIRHRAMRNVPNTYIFSLALADLLVIITCVPFTSILYTVEYWPWGVVVCKVSETAKDISIGVSVFTLTALSAERYCAIVNPLRRLQTKPMTVLSAALIWVLAATFSLPDAINSRLDYMEIDRNKTLVFCSPFPNITDVDSYKKYSIVIKSLVYYIIPLAIIACFYVLMAIRLHHSANEMPGEIRGTQSVAQAKARRHVARMVLIFVFLFFICFLPHHVFMLWFHLNENALNEYNDWWHAIRIIGFCLSFLNSCVNPVALYCVSGVFRSHFNRYLCCQERRWPRNSTMTTNPNCETSFNSTYRKHTQNTIVESQSIYRKGTLARRNTHERNSVGMNMQNELGEKGHKNSMILRTEMSMDHGYCS
ncbi:neuropeptide CCHamide-2 receptor [Aethina tumida]|uniref:neuropeptide CCHamide-2 receptor n=1 Tax=Aethina tumida TaxID=116153 RepID=UPI0021495561|nr:neuropeptide CCHamide-2 receptor [Aethina tumida]